jgi:acyl carrier protein
MATDRPTREEIGRAVRAEIGRRVDGRRAAPVEISDSHTLEALGIASLELFDLAGRLEERLGVDPFEQSFSLNDIRTVADLCRAYDACISNRANAGQQDDVLLASRRRAEARLRRRTW